MELSKLASYLWKGSEEIFKQEGELEWLMQYYFYLNIFYQLSKHSNIIKKLMLKPFKEKKIRELKRSKEIKINSLLDFRNRLTHIRGGNKLNQILHRVMLNKKYPSFFIFEFLDYSTDEKDKKKILVATKQELVKRIFEMWEGVKQIINSGDKKNYFYVTTIIHLSKFMNKEKKRLPDELEAVAKIIVDMRMDIEN